MIRIALGAVAGILVGYLIGAQASPEARCTALLMHPTGDVVASFIDGEWIGDDGREVEIDHLTRMTAEENCP